MKGQRVSLGVATLGATIGCFAIAAAPPTERAKTEGFAVVRVVHNGGGVSYANLIVEEVGAVERNSTLRGPNPSGIDNPATYAGWLEPGEYRLLSLQTLSGTIGAFSGTLNLEELQLPTFSVEAGRLTDLGTLVEQPLGGGRATVVPWNDDRAFGQGWHNELLEEAARAFPDAPKRWDGAAGWSYKDIALLGGASGGLVVSAVEALSTAGNRPSLKEQWSKAATARDFVELSKQSTVALGQPRFDSAGNSYFAGALGQVLRRSPEGEWTHLDTGTLDTLTSVFADGPNIYASSQQGRLLFSPDRGASWSTAAVPVAASVTSISRLPTGEFLAATEATADNDAMIFRGADLLSLSPTPWNIAQAPKSRIPLQMSGMARIWVNRKPVTMVGPVGDRLVVFVADRTLHVYDIGDDRWTESTPGGRFGELYANDSAGLVYASTIALAAAIVASGVRFNDGYISADGGMTWETIAPGRHAGLGFRDRMNGIAVIIDLNGLKPELFTATTSDGGITWTRVGAMLPGFCVTVAYLPPTDELVCIRNDGNILGTRTGEEWVVERAVD